MQKILRALSIFTLALATLVVLAAMITQYRQCSESGGIFVRGLIWFECLEEK